MRFLARPLFLEMARRHALRPHVHAVGDSTIVVLPGVFDPVCTKVGAWMAGVMPPYVRQGERWLEIGTGSGVLACALARAKAKVTATDIDPTAVRNTRLNAALGEFDMDVREGDLFEPVGDERFDVVVANLPFWPVNGSALPLGRAFASGEDYGILRRFSAGFFHVAPTAFTVLSESFTQFPEARNALGPDARLVRRERFSGEWMNLFELGERR